MQLFVVDVVAVELVAILNFGLRLGVVGFVYYPGDEDLSSAAVTL